MSKIKCIAIIICIATIVSCLSGCTPKTAQTVSGFTEFMEAADFEVQDVTADTETNGLATTVLIAIGKNYQIEFYELTDSETGESVFYNNKSAFDNEHSVKTMSSELSFNNYNYYAFTAEENFHMVARIDNTMLWCEADKEYKEEIIDYAKELGYK